MRKQKPTALLRALSTSGEFHRDVSKERETSIDHWQLQNRKQTARVMRHINASLQKILTTAAASVTE